MNNGTKSDSEVVLQKSAPQEEGVGFPTDIQTIPADPSSGFQEVQAGLDSSRAPTPLRVENDSETFFDNTQPVQDLDEILAMLTGTTEVFNEKEEEQFVLEHTVTPELEGLLAIGALRISTNGEPYQTLDLMGDKHDYIEELDKDWGITDPQQGIETLGWLLDTGYTARLSGVHNELRAGNHSGIEPGTVENYRVCIESIAEFLNIEEHKVNACVTIVAWDLDSIGYLVRVLAHVGWLAEKDSWQWIKKAAAKAKRNFADWQEYMISLLVGRSLAIGNAQFPFAMAYNLLLEQPFFLEEHPLATL